MLARKAAAALHTLGVAACKFFFATSTTRIDDSRYLRVTSLHASLGPAPIRCQEQMCFLVNSGVWGSQPQHCHGSRAVALATASQAQVPFILYRNMKTPAK